jgi:hypothetical protein
VARLDTIGNIGRKNKKKLPLAAGLYALREYDKMGCCLAAAASLLSGETDYQRMP